MNCKLGFVVRIIRDDTRIGAPLLMHVEGGVYDADRQDLLDEFLRQVHENGGVRSHHDLEMINRGGA